MILGVDYSREDLSLIEINEKKGRIRRARFTKPEVANFDLTAQSLLLHILKQKPSQIIFDKMGVGQGLYDVFVRLLKDIDCVKMEENGELVYK
jgi:hypothetical protein